MAKTSVFLTISTGVGGGIVVNGRLLLGLAGHFWPVARRGRKACWKTRSPVTGWPLWPCLAMTFPRWRLRRCKRGRRLGHHHRRPVGPARCPSRADISAHPRPTPHRHRRRYQPCAGVPATHRVATGRTIIPCARPPAPCCGETGANAGMIGVADPSRRGLDGTVDGSRSQCDD